MRRLFTFENVKGVAEVGAFLVLAVTMIFIAVQSCSVHKQTNLLTDQINILQSDYEARTRPYLAIEDIEVNRDIAIKDGNYDWLYIGIDLMNFGELPATKVSLNELLMGGEEIAWTSTGEYVVAPSSRDFPSDLILYPGRHSIVTILVDKSTWESTIVEGIMLDIGLNYSWEEKHYWYVGKATLESGGDWRILYDRGE